MKCINEDINQVEVDELDVIYQTYEDIKTKKGGMKKFPNAVCALFDYLYLVIELGS